MKKAIECCSAIVLVLCMMVCLAGCFTTGYEDEKWNRFVKPGWMNNALTVYSMALGDTASVKYVPEYKYGEFTNGDVTMPITLHLYDAWSGNPRRCVRIDFHDEIGNRLWSVELTFQKESFVCEKVETSVSAYGSADLMNERMMGVDFVGKTICKSYDIVNAHCSVRDGAFKRFEALKGKTISCPDIGLSFDFDSGIGTLLKSGEEIGARAQFGLNSYTYMALIIEWDGSMGMTDVYELFVDDDGFYIGKIWHEFPLTRLDVAPV